MKATTTAGTTATAADPAPTAPTLEQVPARIVEEDEAVADLRKDVQVLQAAHDQTVSVLKFLCGRLGLDPQKVLDQVQAKQD